MVIQHLKQIGKVNKLDNGVPHELTKNKKLLKCFILCNNNKAFLDWTVTCDESGFCLTTGNNQLSDLNKKMLQSTSHSQTCMKKRS